MPGILFALAQRREADLASEDDDRLSACFLIYYAAAAARLDLSGMSEMGM
jgi:hypothetical protein